MHNECPWYMKSSNLAWELCIRVEGWAVDGFIRYCPQSADLRVNLQHGLVSLRYGGRGLEGKDGRLWENRWNTCWRTSSESPYLFVGVYHCIVWSLLIFLPLLYEDLLRQTRQKIASIYWKRMILVSHMSSRGQHGYRHWDVLVGIEIVLGDGELDYLSLLFPFPGSHLLPVRLLLCLAHHLMSENTAIAKQTRMPQGIHSSVPK